MNKKRKKSSDTQSERFAKMARVLSCDEDEAAFDAKLGKLARAHPKVPAKAKPKRATKNPARKNAR